jgi:hypothetical protein
MAGKGSRRRPNKVPQAVVDANYETIFGKFVPLYLRKKIHETNTDNPIDFPKEEKPKDVE